MAMNLSNLLQDGKLKKTFMVATLVSTVLGTFSTALTAHDRVMEKKDKMKQKKLDQGQDDKLSRLESQVQRLQSGQSENGLNAGSGGSTSGRSARPRARRRSTGADDDSDDFDRHARRSMAVIGREYEDNVRRLGDRYAAGDVRAELDLQKQIIALQQSVIGVLQDALVNGRSLNNSDIRRLIAAQDRARDGSLEALRSQYDRMLQSSGGGREQLMIESQQSGPPQRQLTMPSPTSDSYDNAFPPPRRVRTLPADLNDSASAQEMFCPYALELQRNFRKDLHPVFAPFNSQRCPGCDVRIPVDADKYWDFETNQGHFTIDSRLLIKSHTPQGDFACVLCFSDRDKETTSVFSNYGALVQHVGTVHTTEEFEREVDISRS